MPDELTRLRRDHAPLLLKCLTQEDEAGLRAAYELGREAMQASVGLLDVVRIHHETCLAVLATVRDVEEARQVSEAAARFLLELIAAFDMTQRGFMEVGLRAGRSAEER